MTGIAAVIPMKSLQLAKSRLAPVLPLPWRRALAWCMLRDVLAACRRADVFTHLAVITADDELAHWLQRRDITVLPEAGAADLNRAAGAASHWASQRGCGAILFLAGDLPLLHPADVARLARQERSNGCDQSGVVKLVPDRHETGTNALWLQPPGVITTCYGKGSRFAHQHLARTAGALYQEVTCDNIMVDLDTPDDLVEVQRRLAAVPTRPTGWTAHLLDAWSHDDTLLPTRPGIRDEEQPYGTQSR